jgi:endonuclease I
MKKICYSLLFIVSINVSMFAQAVLPTSYSWNSGTTLPTGWTGISTTYSGSGNPAPAGKFSLVGDKLTINFNSTPGVIQYDLVGNPTPNTTWAGTFLLEESVDGTTWTTVGTPYTALAPAYTTFTNTLNSASRYARFNFTNKVDGNVGIDNVSIAVGVSTAQEINVKQSGTTIVNGGTYTTGSPVSTMTTINFTVENNGTVDSLHVSNVTLSGPAASDYSVTTATQFTIAATGTTSLSVSFTPSAAGTRDAILTIANDDANNGTYIINLDGIGGNLATEPTAQPTSITFPVAKSYRVTATFVAASPAPDGYLVIRKNGAAITDVPVDGTVYQRGDMIGSSKVVYSSSATAFMPNDIQSSTQYYFAVFAYNGTGTYRNYLTTSPLTGDVTTSGTMQPSNYYNAISTSSSTFVTDLHALVNPHTLQLYSNYGPLMAAALYTRDTTNNQRVITCVYSGENKVYAEPFDWTTDNFSREHTYCHSWMPTTNDPSYTSRPEYNDYHLLTPTDQNNANGPRSNYPLGVVVGTPTYTYLNCKMGNDANGHKVFEPRDSDKGDAARCMLYQCIAYTGVAYSGPPNTDATYGGSWSLPSHISNTIPYGQDQNVLKQWNTMDPPDKFEISRNDYVDSLQGNRNPFIDHPEYMCYIDFSTMMALSTMNCGVAGINENKNSQFVSVSPNPNNGNFTIKYSSQTNEKVAVKLTDMLGRVVYSNTLQASNGNNTVELNVPNLNKGIYMVEWLSENIHQTEKLIIE